MSPRMHSSRSAWAPRLEVTSWPFDEQARERLMQYRQERMRELDVIFSGEELDLRGAHLCGFDFREGYFSGAVLDKVRLLAANLAETVLDGASMQQADLTGCVLVEADLSHCRGQRAVLSWARLARSQIYEADLREADLLGAELDGAVLTGADLRGGRLQDVKFGRTTLNGVRLADCVVTGARGTVYGPIDVSKTEEPELVDGSDLVDWFRDRKARVTLAQSTPW